MKKFYSLLLVTAIISAGCGSGTSETSNADVAVSEETTESETATEATAEELTGMQTLSNEYITMDYDSSLLKTSENKGDSPEYTLIVLPNSISDKENYSNITFVSTAWENSKEFLQDSPETVASIFNMFASTTEIEASDIVDLSSCEKMLSDGGQIRAKYLKLDDDKAVMVFCKIRGDEPSENTLALIGAYQSLEYIGD